ncbi:MAG: hypothetical protein FWE32_10795 [Oscillospiraceae bacterium]|nr:hypothetical protein [Oscillospiraceae bacterium]
MRYRAVITNFSGREEEVYPAFLRIRQDLDSPAVGLSGRFPVGHRPTELMRIRVFRGDEMIFDGRPDEQRFTLSGSGMLLHIEARSRGAILLDNEAMPETLEFPSVHSVFGRLIAPHGFALIAPNLSMDTFTVRKGLTLWDAFSVFTRRTLGRLPYVIGDFVYADPQPPGESLVIGGQERPFSRFEHTVSHYRPISRVFIRDDEGFYHASVENPDNQLRQIRRERYLIPAGEFANIPRWDAASRIRRSMREMESVEVELPGYHHQIRPGRRVMVDHPDARIHNLLVDRSVFILDEKGERATLTLINVLYD